MFRCVFKTYHEYRIVLGSTSLIGVMTGIVDATILDWCLKAFVWSGILLLYFVITAYELTVMETPERPFLQSILLVVTSLFGLLSTHHFTWILMTISIGRQIENPLWISPNIYVDFYCYTYLMFTLFSIYIVFLVYTNLCSRD